jgi:hypothetical protein
VEQGTPKGNVARVGQENLVRLELDTYLCIYIYYIDYLDISFSFGKPILRMLMWE